MAQRDSEGPSRDEVQERIHSLYDRAETATGNFNATRAMSTGTRRRADSVFGRQRRPGDPALGDVAREWFEAARAKLGPTVPAVLPADRLPGGAAGDRPMVPARRQGNELPGLERASTDRTVRELTAGPAAGPDRPVRELTAGPVAELTAAPTAASAAPTPRQETPRALPGASAAPDRSTPTTAKQRSRRKLDAAREMLERHAAGQNPAGGLWGTPSALGGSGEVWQPGQAADAGTNLPGVSPATGFAATAVPPAVPPASVAAPPDGATGLTTSVLPTIPAASAMPAPPATAPGPDPSMPPAALATTAPVTAPVPTPATSTAYATPATSTAYAMPAPPATAPGPDLLTPPAALAATAPVTATTPFGAPAPVASAPPVSDAFAGVPETGYGTKAAKALAFARAQIGKPCVWGASGPDSYDASGLTQAAWKAAGVVLPRSAPDQAAMGTPVPLTGLQPGDLVFFHDSAGHVGICTGNGMMIHAPGPGAYIREESLHYAGQSAIHGAVRPA